MKLFSRLFFSTLVVALTNCSNAPKSGESKQDETLRQTELNNEKSIEQAGEMINTLYVLAEDSSMDLMADMELDHRIKGYAAADTSSEVLILFSIFTDDVEGNPFNYPLGAYYDLMEEDITLRYVGEENGFVKTECSLDQAKIHTVYFEKKWVVHSADEMEGEESIVDFGVVRELEDAGYPFYSVTIEFERSGAVVAMNLNLEETGVDVNRLMESKGGFVKVVYRSELENSLVDLHSKGKSVFGKYAMESTEGYQSVVGILTGADEPTPGDLPGSITVTPKDGEAVDFDYFVDDAIVAENGKEVEAFYGVRVRNEIQAIIPESDL